MKRFLLASVLLGASGAALASDVEDVESFTLREIQFYASGVSDCGDRKARSAADAACRQAGLAAARRYRSQLISSTRQQYSWRSHHSQQLFGARRCHVRGATNCFVIIR